MKFLQEWFRQFLERWETSAMRHEQNRMEAYFAQSADIYDLEARQRAWDRGGVKS